MEEPDLLRFGVVRLRFERMLSDHVSRAESIGLVHGVGDSQPGNMLAAVGAAMAAAKPGLQFPTGQVAAS